MASSVSRLKVHDSLVLQQLQDRLGDVGILAAEDPLIALADRDPAAERAHRLRQLECNVAASQDQQMLRHDKIHST
jgi:hypothetical protein